MKLWFSNETVNDTINIGQYFALFDVFHTWGYDSVWGNGWSHSTKSDIQVRGIYISGSLTLLCGMYLLSELMTRIIMNGGQSIRILMGLECGKKSLLRFTVPHHKACWVMQNNDPKEQMFMTPTSKKFRGHIGLGMSVCPLRFAYCQGQFEIGSWNLIYRISTKK